MKMTYETISIVLSRLHQKKISLMRGSAILLFDSYLRFFYPA